MEEQKPKETLTTPQLVEEVNKEAEGKLETVAKSTGGRPTVMTEMVLVKLEAAFSMDCTIREACNYAGISKDAYYDYCLKNPKYSDRVEALREKPILLARQTVVAELSNPEGARWYLERKRKKEFSTRTELTGGEGAELFKLPEADRKKLDELLYGKQTTITTHAQAEPESAGSNDNGDKGAETILG